ncbi:MULTISPECIES: UpxY family transcription antiterminator [Leptospira]|uniref:Transcription termination/antitermination factor NusG n=3 Tax=Leptospira weilii TaxID=28184 RepID=A0A828Z1H5_9LEPT|nr:MULTISPECIES: UpxY family transcription antiterminator [Leptospira]EMM74522.1 transcription termination/antitermination factor NusG [Leptospira weilii str. 2006001855]EKR64136.1 transcription termination/antitermination factor NusG [Leptospira weilii str. 2006001853]EMJ64297.1 transcription termination/antitermination factor NusG [Leptospira sp. P2653]EMN45753.1 transcription termination/antitermination factor NusG [Leptospira weilii str. LNT 1234]EMN88318.1 transcription termination/antite
MIENSEVNEWYALYTNPRAEKKLKRLLQERKIECFLPLISKKKKWSDRWKVVEEPMYPSYIFVKILFFQDRVKILQLPGAHHFVFYGGKPYVIPDEDLNLVRIFLETYPDRIQVEIQERLLPGKKILIQEGPFAGFKAEIIQRKNEEQIIVKFPGMNLMTSVTLDVKTLKLEETLGSNF